MTTHDRDFMNRIVTKIVEVAGGSVTTFSGDYNFYEREKSVRLKQNEAEFNRQQSMLKKEHAFIARFKARASHAAQVQSRVKMIDKIDRVELIAGPEEMRISLPEIQRGGNDVAVIKFLAKSWRNSDGSEKAVFSGLSAVVRRLDKIAVVGVNGAGKSTFLKILCNQTPPTSGEANIGPAFPSAILARVRSKPLTLTTPFSRKCRANFLWQTTVLSAICWRLFFSGATRFSKKPEVFQAGKKHASSCHIFCQYPIIAWCSTNPPTTLTYCPAECCSTRSNATKERSCSSRTTAISCARSLIGFLRSTGE